jgi:thiamine-phosphate pyrophosphorylase
VKNKNILRIIDVNINRATEGLRVCEDITRFILNDSASTRLLKFLRHKIQEITANSNIDRKSLCGARDVHGDCGRDFSALEKKDNWQSVLAANMQRAKEALRVLEEFSKLFEGNTGERFKKLRFRLYVQEKRLTEKYLNDTN